MARTVEIYECRRDVWQVNNDIRMILMNDGYHEINYNGERVWKKGTGLMTAMHYIKYEFSDNVICISGWVQIGVGELGGKERDLTGFTATIPKKSVAKTMAKMKSVILGG
ncbi:hypothetical protein [Thomasclavelia sp.]|uniref:hypothetical protein n=1 Tax=Thomasclavelia sp. TaxID=3025757 RepID=UPI0025D05EF8|nr:hypothetical protein [Thomasclavelia sp.]